MNGMHQNWNLMTRFRDWWRSRGYICDSLIEWFSLEDEIKYNPWKFCRYMTYCDITDSTYFFDRNLAKIWVGVNWYTLVSFKTLTCWCSVMFRRVVSRYTWYPRLPISAVAEFMAVFKWDKLLMVVDYLIFPFRKKKLWIKYDSFIFSFFVLFSNFWMSGIWVNFPKCVWKFFECFTDGFFYKSILKRQIMNKHVLGMGVTKY